MMKTVLETDEEFDDTFKLPEGTSFTNCINAEIVAREFNEYRNDARYFYTHLTVLCFGTQCPTKLMLRSAFAIMDSLRCLPDYFLAWGCLYMRE